MLYSSVRFSIFVFLITFSSFYCLISLAYENDDELKSCMSGAVTGALYKSTAGLKKTVAGGAIGLVAGGAIGLTVQQLGNLLFIRSSVVMIFFGQKLNYKKLRFK